jgi:hypothetical protein
MPDGNGARCPSSGLTKCNRLQFIGEASLSCSEVYGKYCGPTARMRQCRKYPGPGLASVGETMTKPTENRRPTDGVLGRLALALIKGTGSRGVETLGH